jgi:cytochrome c-type biogenesis protein
MLILYSAGLAIPFIISALLIDRLKETFAGIKRHYKAINIISGVFLIIVGLFMMTGAMGTLLEILG